MKKILLFAAMFAALMSCEKAPEGTEGGNGGSKPEAETIVITPSTYTFGAEDNLTCKVKVQSSGDWTLTPDSSDWLTPSATSGKDGATVTFTAKANAGEDKMGPVTFTFKSGKASATFKAEQLGLGQKPTPGPDPEPEPDPEPGDGTLALANPDDANIEFGKFGGERTVKLTTDIADSELELILEADNTGRAWILLDKETVTNGSFGFTVGPNMQGRERNASITVKRKNASSPKVVVTIHQAL